MIVIFSEQRTYEGFTYLAGEHEVDDVLAERLMTTFPVACKKKVEAKKVASKPKTSKAPAKA